MIKIIIADNQRIIREGLKMILKKESDFIVVAEAHNSKDLFQKIQDFECDVLLLDMDMSERKDTEIISELKKVKEDLPILALSLHPEDKLALRFLKAGASGYLCKNAAFDELVIAIRKISTHGRYLSERLAEHIASDFMSIYQPKPHEQLSNREMETLYLLATGKRVKDIAEELELSKSTVFTYRGRIFDKLEIKNDVELMHYAIKNELIEIN